MRKWQIETELYISLSLHICDNFTYMTYIHVKKHIINHQYSKYSSCTGPSTWVVIVENAEALSFRKSCCLTCPVWMTHLNCILWSSAWPVWASEPCLLPWRVCKGEAIAWEYVATAGSYGSQMSNVQIVANSFFKIRRRLPCSPSAGPER